MTHAGWSLGSGVKGDGVIESITVGLTTYTFTGANQAPVAEDTTAPAVAGGSVSVPLPASDADGDALTYTIEGSPDADGVLEHTFSSKFVGTRMFDYTVDDGNGGSDSGTVTVVVRPAPTVTTFTVKPAAPTVESTVRILLDVSSTGSVKGAGFVVRVDGKKVAEMALPGDGTIGVTLGKMTAGEHVISVLVRKGTYTKGSSARRDDQRLLVRRSSTATDAPVTRFASPGRWRPLRSASCRASSPTSSCSSPGS